MLAASSDHLLQVGLGSFSSQLKTAVDSQMDKVELIELLFNAQG